MYSRRMVLVTIALILVSILGSRYLSSRMAFLESFPDLESVQMTKECAAGGKRHS